MKKYLILLLTPLLFSSCDFSKLTFVGTLNQQIRFNLDQTGPFSSIEEVSSAEIAQNILDLNLNAFEDYRVTKVNVRDVELDFLYSNGNTATDLQNFFLILKNRLGPEEVFANMNVWKAKLGGENWDSQIASQIGINEYLNPVGVSVVKGIVEKALKSPNNIEGIIMEVKGRIPENERLKAVLVVNLKIDIEYVTCEEVPLGVAAESCTDF